MSVFKLRKKINQEKFFNNSKEIKAVGVAKTNSYKFFKTPAVILIGISITLLITALAYDTQNKDYPDPNPQKELESFKLAEGYEVTLFAADPLVAKPIQMNWDAEGRLWVVSSTAYPHLKTGEQANDKIFVLEDTDKDGKADKSTVFAEGLLTPTGILPGDGGVYVANSTEILHFSDTDGDGKADKRRRILNGFGTADTHHLIHTFRWGPEGRLYFNQSIYIYSHVETPTGVKRLEGGGVWKLQPQTLELDVYARGLVNPWGLQFDRWGQSFLTDGAGEEGINYGFPGATFTTALGAERIIRGLNPGQPKHSGLDIISGRHLPDSLQGTLITNDFRANRINRFKTEEQGSGYASKQVGDLMWTDDVAFRPVDISIGPDGAIYVADWYNPIIQHGEVDFHDPRRDQQHGRIWRIVAKNRPLVKIPNLPKATVSELLDALKLPENWTRTQAKQVLKQKGAKEVIPALEKWLTDLDKQDPDYEHQQLEALWVYQLLDVVNEPLLKGLLNAKNPHARAAGIRALQLWDKRLKNTGEILAKAVKDEHPQVRLEAVIGLRKLKTAEAARTSLSAVEQPMDEFLDFALWQTMRELEPMWLREFNANSNFFGSSKKTAFALKSANNPETVKPLVNLYRDGKIPEEYHPDVLSRISKSGDASDLSDILDIAARDYGKQDKEVAAELGALEEAAKVRSIKPLGDRTRISRFTESKNEVIAISAVQLIGLWGMGEADKRLVTLARTGNVKIKKAALSALAALKTKSSGASLLELAGAKSPAQLRLLAVEQLLSSNRDEFAPLAFNLLQSLPEQNDFTGIFDKFFSNKEGRNAFSKLLSSKKLSPKVAKAARKALQAQVQPDKQKDADVVALKKALEASGGTLPPERTPQQPNDNEIKALANEVKLSGNPEQGEVIFRKSACFNCHAIGGAGGQIGPDLSSLGTSSPVETIIRSILYPAKSIKEGFELKKVVYKDGSELMGYLVSDGLNEVIIRDVSGKEVAAAKSRIKDIERVPGSLMPAGLTTDLEKQQFANLVSYLSNIGESGKFRVPNERFVRRWTVVSSDKALEKNIREAGLSQIVNEKMNIPLHPIYSKISGEVPLEELPVLTVSPGKRYSFIKFEIEVLSEGNVKLGLSSTTGVKAWVGKKPLNLSQSGVETGFTKGTHQIMLAIDRTVLNRGVLSVRLQDVESNPAQTRLVMGQ